MRGVTFHRRPAIALIGVVFLAGQAVLADPMKGQEHESRLLSDQFSISYGGLATEFKTSAQVGLGGVLGTVIQLEDDLELDEHLAVGWMNGFWQFNRRHAIDFGYGKLDRTGTTTIDTEIEWEGIRYKVGARVDSLFKMSLLRAQYQYSFFNDGKGAGGITAGLSTFDFDVGLIGQGAIIEEDEDEVIERAAGNTTFLAPVPSVGFFMHYAFNRRTILRMRASALDLSFGDYEGKLLDTLFTVDWFFAQHFAIGGGFVSTDISVRRTGDDPFRIDYRYSGLMLQLSVALP